MSHPWYRCRTANAFAMLIAFICVESHAPGQASSFPTVEPESQGMDSAALRELVAVVQGYIDDESALGAELLVIKNRRTVLHVAFGWKDRENDEPMVNNTIFNIRSMSKPMTGAAVQLLIDRGLIEPDDPMAKFLPGFDNDHSRAITVRQVLTHRSGLPLSIFITQGKSMDAFESLQEMADAVGEEGPEFEVDSKFWYSDSGTDVLGGLVEVVSGESLDVFITKNLFEPLGMTNTFYTTDGAADPRFARIAPLYAGAANAWNKLWAPDDEPFYPYAWGSQSIYSTPMDYAKFLAMWMDEGLVGTHRLLSAEAIDRTLTPVSPMTSLGSDDRFPTDFTGLEAWYGQMAVLHIEKGGSAGSEPVIIGHSGSDGTIAWAWPQRDLMILYFTQSRGGLSALRLEEEIDRLLLHPGREEVAVETPEEYEPYLGTYVANFGPFREAEFTVLVKDGALAVDIPGQMTFQLTPPDEEGKWAFAMSAAVAVSFDRDDSEAVTGMKLYQAGMTFDLPRGEGKVIVDAPLDLAFAERVVGTYLEEDGDEPREIRVFLHEGNLALQPPEVPVPLDLYTPDEEGYWVIRLQTNVKIRFDEDEEGNIVSFTAVLPDGTELVRKRKQETPAADGDS